jgi:hypothetical protein
MRAAAIGAAATGAPSERAGVSLIRGGSIRGLFFPGVAYVPDPPDEEMVGGSDGPFDALDLEPHVFSKDDPSEVAESLKRSAESSDRGAVLDLPSGLSLLITIHPSALLRLRDETEKRSAYDAFVDDLRPIARIVGSRTVESASVVLGL